MMKIRIGTRGSRLAMWQANYVADLLKKNGAETEIVAIKTTGDKVLNVSIAKIGSKGVFTEEIEAALATGDIDIAVHSAKDMPSELPEGFELIAFSEREPAHDVLVSHLQNVDWSRPDEHVVVGTSSTRRKALLKHFYPHVKTAEIRGNLQTRIQKMKDGACHALLLAYAGVHRMGYHDMVIHKFPLEQFVPAVGQGSIAVEVHRQLPDDKTAFVRKAVNHKLTEILLTAERGYLKRLQGGCSIPVFALADYDNGQIQLEAGIISLDGQRLIKTQHRDKPENALTLGLEVAETVLSSGGAAILHEIKENL